MPSEKPFNAVPAGYTEHPVAPEKFAEEVQGVPPVSETFVRADADVSVASNGEFDRDVITLDFPRLPATLVDAFIAERTPGTTIHPELVLPHEVVAPQVYARIEGQEIKEQYRSSLREGLAAAWTERYGEDRAHEIMDGFNKLASTVQEDGAVVFGDLLDRTRFNDLVTRYDSLMQKDGSTSLLHSYANLRNQPDFLDDTGFNRAFFHPLAVALISERVGGAVRVVDARAKDAGPISVRAQDNMLHIDNTPFRDEYKVLVTWEQGKASGPKGQNFVFLPGTHKGVRNSIVGPGGEITSTENGSIFIHPEDVEQAFALQRQVRPGGNAVVEIHDDDRPLTTVFPSGSLVHHRLRTEGGYSRSGLIIAFHRAGDTPGEFISNYQPGEGRILEQALFGFQDHDSDADFAHMLTGYAAEIAEKIDEAFGPDGAIVMDPQAKTLSPKEMEAWHAIATEAPTVEDIKQRANYFPLGRELSRSEFIDLLGGDMMKHDKHGPIDMILYSDGHEEPRKWARNRIREMREDTLRNRVDEWADEITQPAVPDLLTPAEMSEITAQLVENAAAVSPEQRAQGYLDPIERISPQEAYRSVEQLIVDLGENMERADERQTYLSAALFQFWACDELNRLHGNNNPQLRELGGRLLRNYIAAAVLVEKQIAHEKSKASGGLVVKSALREM